MQPCKLVSIAAALVAAASAAQAQDWLVKVGATLYDPHSRTSGIVGIGIPPGADATIDNASTAILVIERRMNANVGIELAVGIPPRVKAKATGTVAFLGDDVLSAKNLAPTLFINYNFGNESDRFRPYLGAGLNYTRFGSIRSKLAPNVKMSDSVGPAVNAGLNYAFTKNLGLYASISRIEVKSEVVAIGSTVLTTQIDFRPWAYSTGVWWRF